MNTVATVSDTRLRAWAILARAALGHTAARAHAAARSAGTLKEAAEQIGSLAVGPGSRTSVAERAARDLDQAAQAGAWLLTRDDPAWTGLGFDDLDQTDGPNLDAPVALWVRGTVDPVSVLTRVGVIGSRAISPRGARITGEIAQALAVRGVHMVGGGAFGVDVLAHQAALDHNAPTTIVSAAGVDRVYPAAHARVFARVAATGAIVSEYPPGEGVDRARLLARNRLVAAMSRQLVIPEAGLRSGTLSTARWAHRLRRPVLAVPGPAATSRGCHQLIGDGHAHPVHSVTDVLTALDETAEPEPRHQRGDQQRTDTDHHRLGCAPTR